MAPLRDLLNRARRYSAAVWALVACSLLTLPGFANAVLQSRTSEWRHRLIHGQPVVVRFACGTNSDCRASYTISYSRRESQFCEYVRKNDEPTGSIGRCGSSPPGGSLSIDGVIYSYDRLGVVRRDSKFVGQLMLP